MFNDYESVRKKGLDRSATLTLEIYEAFAEEKLRLDKDLDNDSDELEETVYYE